VEIVIAVVVLVVAVLIIGAAPSVKRAAHARDLENRARLSRGTVDINRSFERPRDEGELL
jgi:hypothetical protein